MMRALLLGLLATAMCCEAHAHAFLDRARPAVGSTVRTAPAEVRLIFSEDLEPAFSTLKVLDKGGVQIDKQDKQLDAGNHGIIKVSLPALGPGTYRVVWRILSVDGHVTQGDYIFTVAP